VIEDGELLVKGGSRIKGTNVGFYFRGSKATLNFEKDTTVSLTAPKSGTMAGLLFFQDKKVSGGNLKYEISSDNAPTLLGTIYLPNGHFYAAGDKPVAQSSAYTIIIAKEIHGAAGPVIVLNSNYNQTDVPVPSGLGNLSNTVALDR